MITKRKEWCKVRSRGRNFESRNGTNRILSGSNQRKWKYFSIIYRVGFVARSLPINSPFETVSDYSRETISKNVLEKTNEEEKEEEENFLSFAYLFYFYLPTLIFIGLPKHIFKLMKRGGRIPAPYSTIPYSGITRSFPLYLPVKLGRRRRRNLNPLSTARDRRNHDEKKNLLLRSSTFGKRISKFRSNGKIGESITRGETETRY